MSMIVKNNLATQMTLAELNKNSNNLEKDLQKISSGQKINFAKDNSSDYAISEKMRVLIRALNQDISNSQTGMNLVKTAEGGIQGIIDSLGTLEELAINSLNGHNSDEDRKILQKEFSSRMAEIDSIACETNYNGIILLDGRWRQASEEGETVTKTRTETVTEYETVTEEYEETVTTYEEVEEVYTETTVTYIDVVEEYPYTYAKVTEKPLESQAVRPSTAVPTGVTEPGIGISQIIPPTASNYTISRDGSYVITENYTGNLYITAKNVKLTAANPKKMFENLYIITSSEGGTNLWIENMNMGSILRGNNGSPYAFEESFIKFQGADNVLTIKGMNKFNTADIGASNLTYDAAFINVGNGLTIEGDGTMEFHQRLYSGSIGGAFIGSDRGETSNADIIINSGNIITSSEVNNWGTLCGAVIGSGENGSIGNIIINGGTFDLLVSGGGACIGGGDNSTTGYITVQDATIKAQCDDGACIGSGGCTDINNSSRTDYIYILNSDLDLYNVEKGGHSGWENPSGTGAAIGGGGTYHGASSYVGDITVENSRVKAVTDRGAGIGTGGDSEIEGTGKPHAYGIKVIDSTLDITVNDSRAEEIGKGVNGIIPVEEVEEEVTEMRTLTVTVPREETVTKTRIITVPHEEIVTKTRTYTVAHEVTRTVEYEEKINFAKNPLIIHTGPKANEELRLHINDMRTKAIGLEDAAVDPLEKAREALKKIDLAIDYALNENTRMGAYQSRLAATVENLVVEHENAIAAESIIRDADMAKEMASYTKNNVLLQAAQAMLAQANQNSNSVLTLLQ